MEVFFKNLTAENASLEQLSEDVSLLLDHAEALAQASGANLSETSKAELESVLERVKTRGERIRQQARAGVRATDRFIRLYPYLSWGIVFGLGVIVGALLKRI